MTIQDDERENTQIKLFGLTKLAAEGRGGIDAVLILDSEYKELMDKEQGYSPKRMLEILKDRGKYLIERGSTLNNPHIPTSYFKGWEQITSNHKQRLRALVVQSLSI